MLLIVTFCVLHVLLDETDYLWYSSRLNSRLLGSRITIWSTDYHIRYMHNSETFVVSAYIFLVLFMI